MAVRTRRGTQGEEHTSGGPRLKVEVIAPQLLGRQAATRISILLEAAVRARGTASLAVSGGSTPIGLFDALAKRSLPWEHIHVVQVDERVAPTGHADRNLTELRHHLIDTVGLPEANLHPIPVTTGEPEDAAASYEATLRKVAGEPPVLDVVHLGLGADGHAASLIPDDAVLEVRDRDVAATRVYEGRRRVTLTYPALERARTIIWLVAGADKQEAAARLWAGDDTIPAGRVKRSGAVLLIDQAAAQNLTTA